MVAIFCGCLLPSFKTPSYFWDFFKCRQIHSLLVNKVTCGENKVGEKGATSFGCPSKKEEECMLLFGGGQQAGQT